MDAKLQNRFTHYRNIAHNGQFRNVDVKNSHGSDLRGDLTPSPHDGQIDVTPAYGTSTCEIATPSKMTSIAVALGYTLLVSMPSATGSDISYGENQTFRISRYPTLEIKYRHLFV